MTGVLLMLMVAFIPIGLFFWNQQRCAHKCLVLFLEGDKFVKLSLLPVRTDFVVDSSSGQAYYIFPERIRLVRYPSGWPTPLQQTVPTIMYERGDGEPKDWVNLGQRKVSATEIGASLEPEWLKNIVKGAREASGETKLQKMLPLLSVALSAICMLLLFVVMSKIG